MILALYKNKSDTLHVNKDIEHVENVTGTLREECSILVPTLTLNMTAQKIGSFNYIYIVEFARYYYVVGIESIRDDLWTIHCEIDVLMTYREKLKEQYAIVSRQENLYNLYLDDDRFMVNAQRMVVTKAFPNRVIAGNADAGSLSYVFTVAGGKPVEL